jgi:flavin reductase (DIM6/NTAB) family NADH-FMN oxidoreductase RutF
MTETAKAQVPVDIDPRRYREVLGHYPTGVALVTAMDDSGTPVGMIVGSFTSVSLDPPIVAYLPSTTSYAYARISTAKHFVINVLSAAQEDVCRRFASRIDDKWAGVTWKPSPNGAPILDEAVAWIECAVDSVIEVGDHYIVLGQILELAAINPQPPLLFFQGGYGRFTIGSLVAGSAPDLASAIRMADSLREDIQQLAEDSRAGCDLFAPVGGDLVYVGSASFPGLERSSPALGTRIPLLAPLGEQYVCWASEDDQLKWMTRSGVTDPKAQAELRHRLEIARERGWSMSRMVRSDEFEFYQALRQYTEEDLLPARERVLREQIVAWSQLYAPIDIADDEPYSVHSLVVPITCGDGDVVMSLRLVGLPDPTPGWELNRHIGNLKNAAHAMSIKLQSHMESCGTSSAPRQESTGTLQGPSS